MDSNTKTTAQSREQFDRRIGELLEGIVHALPQVALGQTPIHTAASRANDFRAAFAATRKH
jgi:hypothetical protein